jgi:hypothetical protein
MKKTNSALIKVITVFYLLIIQISSYTYSQEKSIIPILLKNNKTHVTVKIGNTEIPDIILDTGFSYDGIIIYNPDYKDSLDLTKAIEVNIGGAGTGDAQMALMLDSTEFFVGDIKMKNQRVIMLQSDIYKGFPSNGVIGYSLFGHYVTEINNDKNTMTLYDTDKVKIDNSWTEIPLYFKDNSIPWIDAFVVIENEAPVLLSMYIDYAAGDNVLLLEKPAMKFFLPKETVNYYIGTGLSGDIYGKTGRISKLIIGSYELKNVTATFATEEIRSKQKNADAILGNGSLRRFNLIFDYKNKKLYLKPNKFFDEPFK